MHAMHASRSRDPQCNDVSSSRQYGDCSWFHSCRSGGTELHHWPAGFETRRVLALENGSAAQSDTRPADVVQKRRTADSRGGGGGRAQRQLNITQWFATSVLRNKGFESE